MEKTLLYAILFISVAAGLNGQQLAGVYADGLGGYTTTRLELRENGTFSLEQADPVFTNEFRSFTSTGVWSATGDTVWLNPEKAPLRPQVRLTPVEKAAAPRDSLTLHLHSTVQWYAGDTLARTTDHPLEQVTIYLDKPRKGLNLVRDTIVRHCAFARRVKRQLLPRADGTFRLPASERPARIGVLTYGFNEIAWLPLPAGTTFELDITLPVDEDRTPRRKPVIIRKKKAYFYEAGGKVRTGGWLTPLLKVKG